MFLDLTDDESALRDRLRGYFAATMTDDVRAALATRTTRGTTHRALIRRFGADGWLGIGWPVEYGGQGGSPVAQFLFFDEARRAGAPLPFVTLNTVGPTMMRFGSAQQKQEFLPRILDGSIHFAIGYSEPAAGTDLAALKTRAVRHGDSYVVSGEKVFTSGGDDADYIWLAARTDPDAGRHRGISILLVDTRDPGFQSSPIETVGGVRTTITRYDGVRVPVANLVGEEGAGWSMITTQLNHERVGLAAMSGLAHRLWSEVREWAAMTPAGPGGPARLLDVPWVQLDLARSWATLDALALVNWRLVAGTATQTLEAADASAAKVFGTESLVEVYHRLLGIVGTPGYLRSGSPGAVLRGELEQAGRAAQVNTFGGGVNEVQRVLIATGGLGMPRPGR